MRDGPQKGWSQTANWLAGGPQEGGPLADSARHLNEKGKPEPARPRPRPPEISTCCGLSRPRRRRRPPGVEFAAVPHMAVTVVRQRQSSRFCNTGEKRRMTALRRQRDAYSSPQTQRERKNRVHQACTESGLGRHRHGLVPSLYRAACRPRASHLP